MRWIEYQFCSSMQQNRSTWRRRLCVTVETLSSAFLATKYHCFLLSIFYFYRFTVINCAVVQVSVAWCQLKAQVSFNLHTYHTPSFRKTCFINHFVHRYRIISVVTPILKVPRGSKNCNINTFILHCHQWCGTYPFFGRNPLESI